MRRFPHLQCFAFHFEFAGPLKLYDAQGNKQTRTGKSDFRKLACCDRPRLRYRGGAKGLADGNAFIGALPYNEVISSLRRQVDVPAHHGGAGSNRRQGWVAL
jgi:hypothetical protein